MYSLFEKCALRQNCLLRAMLLGTVLVALAFPIINGWLVYPAYQEILVEGVEHDVALISSHVAPRLFTNQEVAGHTTLGIEELATLEAMERDFDLVKIRFFNESGVTLYSTDSTEFGSRYDPLEFKELVSRTSPVSELTTMSSPYPYQDLGKRDVVVTFVPSIQDGRFVGALESYTDVTERKEHMDFIARISIATMAFMAIALVVAVSGLLRKQAAHVELLETTQELRSDVERIVQHDLRSPLTNILSGTNYLQSSVEDKDHLEILEQMQTSGWRMMRMINRSLDLYKMESGTYEFIPAAVNIIGVMQGVTTELADLALSRWVKVRITCEGKPVSRNDRYIIPAEEMLCHTLLANLLKNALEAAPRKDAVVMDISRGEHEHILSVSNPGDVPEDIRPTFFDKYVTHGKRTGTGLGTYSARLITETQGGTIKLLCDGKTVTLAVHFPQDPEIEIQAS